MALTEDETKAFKGMAQYWAEVRKRDDRKVLVLEAVQVNNILGIRVLNLVEDYIELLEERDTTLKILNKINDVLKEGAVSDGQT